MSGLFDTLYKAIPTNIRLVGEQIAGVSRPITEKDFSQEELNFIRQQITTKEQENITRQQQLQTGIPEFNKPPYQDNPQYQQVKNLLQKELDSYTKSQEKTAIKYKDYTAAPGDLGWIDVLKSTFNNPEFRVSTSLGQYVGVRNPDGSLNIIDKYNWDNERKVINSLKPADYPKFLANVLTNPASALATVLAKAIPDRKTREVNVRIENPTYRDPFGDTTK